MLALEVAFLTGRYIATSYSARDEAEWPPHPARLFSALTATHTAADWLTPEAVDRERDALEWLEQQDAPSICCSPAATREIATVFVPVNDVALTNVDDEATKLEEARTALQSAAADTNAKARARLEAAAKKAEATLAKAIERATAVPTGKSNPLLGRNVLPEHRNRQPRTFPSVTPETPAVTFIWPDADAADEKREALDRLLARLVRLGHSSSLVAARIVRTAPQPTWQPDPAGTLVLRVVQPGQLASLKRAFALHNEVEPRVMPFRAQTYARPAMTGGKPAPTSCFSSDWLVFRRVGGPQFPMTAAVGIARAVRGALMASGQDPLPEILTGHRTDGAPSEHPHLAIVPLPFVGHEHATGSALGIALVLPQHASEGDRRAVYQAVAAWESKFRKEDEETPTVELHLGVSSVLELERVADGPTQASLRPATWCAESRAWLSATPVALDRNPGDLRSRNPERLARAVCEARESIERACQRIGLPKPTNVQVLPAAPWAGAAKARQYPAFPGDPGRTQRVLTHISVTFDEPVAGPLILGAGRYVGLGLLRPTRAL